MIKVVLADDHRLFREGLKNLIASDPKWKVVGEANTGLEAIRLVNELSPDVVLMDVTMPDMNGIEATRRILARTPNVKVLAVSMYSYRRLVIEMLRAGAKGYILKDCAFEELVAALESVLQNKIFLSPSLADSIIQDYVQNISPGKEVSVFSILTKRELEILKLIAEGKSVKQIGHLLHLSAKTVETHRLHIMDKLNIKSIAGLTRYALREGLTTL